MLGIALLAVFYVAICLFRYKYARHYGQKLRLLGWQDLCECWDCLNFSQNALTWKIFIVAYVLGCILFILLA